MSGAHTIDFQFRAAPRNWKALLGLLPPGPADTKQQARWGMPAAAIVGRLILAAAAALHFALASLFTFS